MENFKGKKILVLGLGLHGGGVGTVKFLAKAGAKITVSDLRTKKELLPSLKSLKNLGNIRYVLGQHRKKDLLEAELIIKNPGVRPDSPYLRFAKARKIPITTDIEIFFKNCPATVIGVTGTRGKSTTAYLIAEFLKRGLRQKVYLGGNIRTSVFEVLGKVKKGDLVVLELSSFQLQDLAPSKISPSVAVLTNLQRDHLNWHKTFASYMRAKSYIFAFQKREDYLFANPEDRMVKKLVKRAKSKTIFSSLPNKFKVLVRKKFGRHYEVSVALAIAVARLFKISQKDIGYTLKKFNGLPERQQRIATVKGVDFIDDTTATTPDAAIAALRRFGSLKSKRLVLIAGGQDKRLDFRTMTKAMQSLADEIVLLPGSATKKIRQKLPPKKVHNAASMEEAVKIAYRLAKNGDTILLSPGAASFGLFLNEFDRGKRFIDAVRDLEHVSRHR